MQSTRLGAGNETIITVIYKYSSFKGKAAFALLNKLAPLSSWLICGLILQGITTNSGECTTPLNVLVCWKLPQFDGLSGYLLISAIDSCFLHTKETSVIIFNTKRFVVSVCIEQNGSTINIIMQYILFYTANNGDEISGKYPLLKLKTEVISLFVPLIITRTSSHMSMHKYLAIPISIVMHFGHLLYPNALCFFFAYATRSK